MSDKKFSILEKTPFLILITFLGGYLDAYTYVTRGGVFANNHTGNVAKLGVTLANGNLIGAWDCLLPIIACVLGAATAEFVRLKMNGKITNKDWRIKALYFQCIVLFLIGFIPQMFPDVFVNTCVTFITGFQLCLFRVWEGSAHNTTICTGNLRNVGQLLFGAIDSGTLKAYTKFLRYVALVFSFTVGAAIGTILCVPMGVKAIWAGCILIFIMIFIMEVNQRKENAII